MEPTTATAATTAPSSLDPPISLRRSGGLAALGVALGAACGAAALGLLARRMRSGDFVSLAALIPAVGLISVLGRFGFDRLAVRHYWLAPDHFRARAVLRYLLVGILVTAALAAVALLGSEALPGGWPGSGRLGLLPAALVLLWCVSETARYGAADLPRSWGRDLTAMLVGHGSRNVLWLAAVVLSGLVVGHVSLASGIATVAVASAVVGIAGVAQVARRARIEARSAPARAPRPAIELRVVRSGLAVALVLVAGLVIDQFDVVVVSGSFASRPAASYAVASRLATMFALSLVVLSGVLPSLLGRVGLITEGEYDPKRRVALRQVMALTTTVACAVSFASVLAFVVLGRELLTRGLGSEFGGAYGLALVLLLGQTINLATGATAVLLIIVREEAYVARVAVVAAVAAVVAELAAAHMGVYWVAVASAVAVAIPNIVYSLRLRRVVGFAPLPTVRLATLRGGLQHLRGTNRDDPTIATRYARRP
jgi:O-antigen/teichoic acid export membrane protein